MEKLWEETQLTNKFLEKQIKKGFKNLKDFIEGLKCPYWFSHIKLEDFWMGESLYERVRLQEKGKGRTDNKFLENKEAMKESLKKCMYFPLVTQGQERLDLPLSPPILMHAGRNRFVRLMELLKEGKITLTPGLKVPVIGINRRYYNITNYYVEVPKPISRLVKIKFKGKVIEGYEKTNLEIESGEKFWVLLTNGDYHFTALNLISQRTGYYLYKWRELNKEDYPVPRLTRYK